MSNVIVYCPDIDGPPPTGSECGVSKNITWSNPGTVYKTFYVKNINLAMISFNFVPLSNNGSTINVSLVYPRNGTIVTAQTFNLGSLSSTTKKYHYLNFGNTAQQDGYITLQVDTVGGSSGEFIAELDCAVDVVKGDFCYQPQNTASRDLCDKCTTTQTVYWEQTDESPKLGFSYGPFYIDPELQTLAPYGYYRIKNTSGSFIIYLFTGGFLTRVSSCGGDEMECNNTITFSHTKTGYTQSNPYLPGTENIPNGNLKYSVKTINVLFPNTNYGYFTLNLSYAGSAKDICFTISDVNAGPNDVGFLSYSSSTTQGVFLPLKSLSLIQFPKGSTTMTINVSINGSSMALTDGIKIRAAVGQNISYNSNSTVTTTISASCLNNLYSYTAGLHAYSDYDAYVSPKLTTKLYSTLPVGSWVKGTKVFNDPLLGHPAMPWFYAINNNVYKVGVLYKREFGTQKSFVLKTSIARQIGKWIGLTKQNVKIDTVINGPKDWSIPPDFLQVPSCVEPMMDPGIIKQVIPSTSLIQPTSYMYFVGFNASTKTLSNEPFYSYDYSTSTYSASTGFDHMVSKVPQGYIAGLPVGLADSLKQYLQSGLESLIIYGTSFALTTAAIIGVISLISTECVWAVNLASYLAPFIGAIAGLVLVAALIIYAVFKTIKKVIAQNCRNFLKVYSTGPYVETSNSIYRLSGLTSVVNGYYSDGCYFYTQNSGSVTAKETSYIIKNGGVKVESVLPDVPTLVTEIPKLFLLPYVSGRPVKWTGNPPRFLSGGQANTSTPNIPGELQNPLPITYELPEGFIESSVSQEEADADASEYLSGLTANTINYYVSAEQKPGVSGLTVTFTHEIKEENLPSQFPVAFDNSNNLGITIGKKLYYDINGIYSVLDGYYSIPDPSGTNYKLFYSASTGNIVDILTMSASSSTTVRSQVNNIDYPISFSNQEYTSSWYFADYNPLNTYYNEINNLFGFNQTWNTNTFYNSPVVRKGFINNPNTKDSLYFYDSNFNVNSYSPSDTIYLKEIPDVFNESTFIYSTAFTITINFVQSCSDDSSNGVKAISVDPDGEPIPSLYGLNFSVDIYKDGIFNSTYTVNINGNESEVLIPLTTDFIGHLTDVTINTFNSQNPINKVIYVEGTFTSCSSPTPTPTPVLTSTPTQTPSVTPTTPLGECYQISNGSMLSAVDVSYIDNLGTNVCTTLAQGGSLGDVQVICILAGTSSSIIGYSTTNGTCSGDAVVIGILNLMTSCQNSGECDYPTPTPSETPASTPDSTPAETPSSTPAETPASTPDSTPAETPASTLTPTPTPTIPSVCTSYTVIDIGNLAPSTFTYQDCTTLNTEEITLSDGSEITICAITGSILLVSGLIDIINNGPCEPSPTPTNTQTPTSTPTPQSNGTVYININGPSSADNTGETGSGNSQIVSQSVNTFSSNSDFVNVVSNLEIYAVCYGENNTSYDLRYINIGDHCASGVLFTGLDPFELIDAYFVISVSPTSDGTYNYATGTGFRDSTYTC